MDVIEKLASVKAIAQGGYPQVTVWTSILVAAEH